MKNPMSWCSWVLAVVVGGAGCGGNAASPTAPTSSTPLKLLDLEGAYSVTFTAADSCSQIPTELRTRTYVATGSPQRNDRTTFTLALSGASFQPAYETFFARVAGDTVTLSVHSWDAARWWLEDHPIIERLGEGRSVEMMGTARADVPPSASSITAVFAGTYSYCPAITEASTPSYPTTCSAPVTCQSDRHQLSLARR
jgi:hypothetical protein